MKTVFTLLLFITLVAPTLGFSENSQELPTLNETVINQIKSEKPDWKHKAISPIVESSDVILQQWSFEKSSVRISVVSHKSVKDAIEAMRSLLRRDPRVGIENQENELFESGRTVLFRKRHLVISVNAVIIELTSDAAEVAKRAPDERKLSREFAQLVSKAIRDN